MLLCDVIMVALEWLLVPDDNGRVAGFLLLQPDELESSTDAYIRNGGIKTRYLPSQVFTGGYFGVGAETFPTDVVSVGIEYRYADYGHASKDRMIVGTDAFSTQVNQTRSDQSFRATLNFHPFED